MYFCQKFCTASHSVYLSDRHTTHTRVQNTSSCIGAHFAREGEALPPSNAVGLHGLPATECHQELDHLKGHNKKGWIVFIFMLGLHAEFLKAKLKIKSALQPARGDQCCISFLM